MNNKSLKEFESKDLTREEFGNLLRLVEDELRSLVYLDGVFCKSCLYGALRGALNLVSLASCHYQEFNEDYE